MWHEMCTNGILLPGHSTISFIWDQSANFDSAANLLCECPCSLLTALAATHPERDAWLHSFCEEKDGISSQDTYDILNLAKYHALHKKGAP
jgi:hypothetical protein